MTNPNNQGDTDLDTLRDQINFNISELRRRKYPCQALNAKLIEQGFTSSNNFKSILAKVARIEAGNVFETLANVKKVVDSELEKHVALANKRLYFFAVPNDTLLALQKKLKDQEALKEFCRIGTSHEKFDHSSLEDGVTETSLVKRIDSNLEIFYFKQARNRRENFFAPEKVGLFKNDEDGEVINIIKVVQYHLNAFDFIALDFQSNHVVIGTDLTNRFPKEETEKAQDRFRKIVRKFGNINNLELKSLRNCVENLEKEAEGYVLDHAFVTAFGGYNHAGRSVTTTQDVRKDDFHTDGIKDKEADYYGIIKSYDLPNDEKATIAIRITYRDYMKVNVPIRYAIINDVTSFEGLKFCISKIIKHNHN